MTTREKIIDVALKEVGYSESEGNKTKYGVWFGWDGQEWCGIFCSWVYFMAGVPIKKGGFSMGFAGVGTLLNNYRKNMTNDPQHGDLVIFDWNLDNKPDHVALFNGWIVKGKSFKTIEGNTSLANDSSGGRVMERERKTTLTQCFISLV